jgi:aminoglycoside phosphotransferase (APT) family kinase protein
VAELLGVTEVGTLPNHNQIAAMLRVAGIRRRVGGWSLLAEGLLNTVIRVSFNDGPDLVIRIRRFQHPEYGQEFAAERLAYPLIESTGVCVPRLLYASNEGFPFAVFEHVEGPLLDAVLQRASWTLRAKLLESLASSLARIHSVKGDGYGTLRSFPHSRHQRRSFFEGLLVREAARLREFQIDFATAYEGAVPRWLDTLDRLPPNLGEPTLVHGDVHGRNIIVRPDNGLVMIDWEASRFRIGPYDLAQVLWMNLRSDTKAADVLLRAYAHALPTEVDSVLLREAILVCRYFWHCRMGLFLMQHPATDTSYFGMPCEHLAIVRGAL